MNNIKKRNSNIELFRIIIMLFIISHHYVVNSGLTAFDGAIYTHFLSWRSIFLLIFGAWGKTGINCFVLITGYFMCKSNISAKKFVKLFFEIMFYRIIIYIIFWLTGYTEFTLKQLIIILIPIRDLSNDFNQTYLLFFLFIPFLNKLIHSLNEKYHLLLIILSLFMYTFFGTIPFFHISFNYVSWFMVLYLVSSYIRLYPRKIFKNKFFWKNTFLLSIISVLFCAWLSEKLKKPMAFYFVTDSNTFLAFLTGVSSFLVFLNLDIKYNKFINMISASTFGVLLIHAHSDEMRYLLWNDIFRVNQMYYSPFLIIYAVTVVLTIFVICIIIDKIRIKFVEIPFFKLWDKYYANYFMQTFYNWNDKLKLAIKKFN